jgi:DNA-binding NarL/FixJ family response regulator
LKFLVVDDHALIRDATRSLLLQLHADAAVLDAADGAAALRMLDAHPDTDLVLLDLDLPDQHGLQVLARVAERHPAVAVVVLSGSRDQTAMRAALDRGAQGFIPKAETREVLTGALALVLAGGVYVPPSMLTGAPRPAARAGTPAAITPQSLGITERQLEVLALLMQGKNNKLICRALGLAEPTVKNHVSAILKALGVSSRTEAVLAVARHGWTLPGVD